MFSKSNLLATLGAFITMFLLGYGIWEFLLADFFEAHTLKSSSERRYEYGINSRSQCDYGLCIKLGL